MVQDETARRIGIVVRDFLEKLATDPATWDILYRDPGDNRLWELTRQFPEMHGEGPPLLRVVPPELAKTKYKVDASQGLGTHGGGRE